MPPRDTDTRTVTLVDLPLVKRLTEKGVMLDSELGCTRNPNGPNSTLLSWLPQRGFYTLVARADNQQVVGQFRLKSDQPNAQITYMAPELDGEMDDTAWLQMLDAMAREAGKHNAHALVAEIDENSSLFETMRTAGFAVYARQQIWRRLPEAPLPDEPEVMLADQTEADYLGILSLHNSIVPSLMHSITTPPPDSEGWVYRHKERVEAHIAMSEGKHGIYFIPNIHPDVSEEAPAIFATALRRHTRTSKLAVYVVVRRHQDWLGPILEQVGFEAGPRQAVMVRHITAGIRQTSFALPQHELGLLAKPAAKPPTKPLRHHVLDYMSAAHLYQNQESCASLWKNG